MPPYLAGRKDEIDGFQKLLGQEVVLENLVLTGLRGVGKTVLLETFKPLAVSSGWLWVGTDLSEAASISEANLVLRVLTDLSVATGGVSVKEGKRRTGFGSGESSRPLDFQALADIYDGTPGLVSDKLKQVLELVSATLAEKDRRGIIFAYDEAQNLADRHDKEQYPLSLLLDVFQSIQRKGVKFMLVLTGLPTLFPKLVEARTFAERMFRVMTLDRLPAEESRLAIEEPLKEETTPVHFTKASVKMIGDRSGGYPYFIQFICREVFDVFLQRNLGRSGSPSFIPIEDIIRKLDSDFFAGRWAKPTDRQRELLRVIALLEHPDREFTVQEVVAKSAEILQKPFSPSHVNQMLGSLADLGLIYKNRHGKYSFAVPLFGQFILRQIQRETEPQASLFS